MLFKLYLKQSHIRGLSVVMGTGYPPIKKHLLEDEYLSEWLLVKPQWHGRKTFITIESINYEMLLQFYSLLWPDAFCKSVHAVYYRRGCSDLFPERSIVSLLARFIYQFFFKFVHNFKASLHIDVTCLSSLIPGIPFDCTLSLFSFINTSTLYNPNHEDTLFSDISGIYIFVVLCAITCSDVRWNKSHVSLLVRGFVLIQHRPSSMIVGSLWWR